MNQTHWSTNVFNKLSRNLCFLWSILINWKTELYTILFLQIRGNGITSSSLFCGRGGNIWLIPSLTLFFTICVFFWCSLYSANHCSPVLSNLSSFCLQFFELLPTALFPFMAVATVDWGLTSHTCPSSPILSWILVPYFYQCYFTLNPWMPVYSSGLKFSMPKNELIIFSPHTSSVIIFPYYSQCCHHSVFWARNFKIVFILPSQPPFSRQSSNPATSTSEMPSESIILFSILIACCHLTLYFGFGIRLLTIQLCPIYPVSFPHCTWDILIINICEPFIPLLKK